MKRRTLAVVLVLFFLLTAGIVFGALQYTGERGTLTELWISDTGRDTVGNHHAPAVARLESQTIVVAPANAPQDVGNCALVAFTTDLERKWQASVPRADCNVHAFGDPTIADLDRDGDQEVFVATTEDVIHAYDLRTGRPEFNNSLTGWGYPAPVVTDFAPEQGRELVVADLNGGISVFDANGSLVWRRNLSSVIAPIYVDDFDADGSPELAVGDRRNVTLLAGNGSIERQTGLGGSVTWMTTGQADGDPAIEIVAAMTNGNVVAVDGGTGRIEWTREFNTLAAVHAFGDGDDDGQAEVYAVAQDGKLRSINAETGAVEWTTTLTTADVQMTPPPSLGDLDGDGDLELAAVSQDGVVSIVNPNTGAVITSYEREVPVWMRPTLADLDGDGSQEILVVYGDARVVALSFDSD